MALMEEKAMEILLVVGIGGVAIAWVIGWVRAVKRQPIHDRLHTYCRREE
jgi:hypothetical protein